MHYNSYWYLGLAIISMLLLIYMCFIKKVPRSFLLFLIMCQIAYFIETVIYIFGGSYQYFPKVIKPNAFYDSNIGALVSNLFTVPILATFIASFHLKKFWIYFFTAFLAAIELLFVKLQIYVQYWWKTIYTSIGLILVYFPLAKVFYKKITQPLKGFSHSIFLFLCTAPISGTFHIIPIMLLSNRIYRPGWFEDYGRDTTAFASIFYPLISILTVILVKLPLKNKWFKYIFLGTFVFAGFIILKELKILYSLVWWDPWYYTFCPLITLKISEIISKHLSNPEANKKVPEV